jgi:hypothetical protein
MTNLIVMYFNIWSKSVDKTAQTVKRPLSSIEACTEFLTNTYIM